MKANEFDSVFQKSYFQLSEEEKLEMKDLFTNEDEFNQMKVMLHSVHQMLATEKEQTPSDAVKTRLDELYTDTYRNKGILWYNSVGTFFINSDKSWHQQNLLRIAAVAVLVLGLIPFWNSDLNESKQQIAQLESEDQMKTVPLKEERAPAEMNENEPMKKESSTPTATFNFSPEFASKDKDIATASFAMTDDLKMAESSVAEDTEAKKMDDIGFSAPASVHPDGIFMGVTKTQNASFVLSNHIDVLDILTATY